MHRKYVPWHYIGSDTTEIEGRSDADRFHSTMHALGLIGVTPDVQGQMLSALAGILYLGEVRETNSLCNLVYRFHNLAYTILHDRPNRQSVPISDPTPCTSTASAGVVRGRGESERGGGEDQGGPERRHRPRRQVAGLHQGGARGGALQQDRQGEQILAVG